jgi:uncharacterized protein YcbK (DUF882 family)
MKLTKNFSKSEFECRCGCEMPKDVLNNVQKLANQLQIIRNKVNVPITINSAYRCPKHNFIIGGAKSSQHLQGKASDIVIDGYSNDDVANLIEELIASGDILQGGLGRYNSFTHYDIRKTKARWDFRKK